MTPPAPSQPPSHASCGAVPGLWAGAALLLWAAAAVWGAAAIGGELRAVRFEPDLPGWLPALAGLTLWLGLLPVGGARSRPRWLREAALAVAAAAVLAVAGSWLWPRANGIALAVSGLLPLLLVARAALTVLATSGLPAAVALAALAGGACAALVPEWRPLAWLDQQHTAAAALLLGAVSAELAAGTARHVREALPRRPWWRGAAVGVLTGLLLHWWPALVPPIALPIVVGAAAWAGAAARRPYPFAAALLLVGLLPSPRVELAPDSSHPVMARSHGGEVRFEPATQRFELWLHGELRAAQGPGLRPGALVASLLPHLTGDRSRPLGWLGLGDTRELRRLPADREQRWFGVAAAELALAPDLARVGPVPVRPWAPFAPSPAIAAAVPPDALAGSSLAGLGALAVDRRWETVEFHAAARRAVGAGPVLLQWPRQARSHEELRAALAAASAVHPCTSLLLVGDSLLLLGSAAPVDWSRLATAFAAAPLAERFDLYELGLAAVDLPDCELWHGTGALAGPRASVAVRHSCGGATGPATWRALLPDGGQPAALAATRLLARDGDRAAIDELGRAAAQRPAGCLLYREWQRAQIQAAERTVAAAPLDNPGLVAQAAAAAQRTCHWGPPSALLRAALALPDRHGERALPPEQAAQCAWAIDPTLTANCAPALAHVLASGRPWSPLADLCTMPAAAELAARAVGSKPDAIALRARHPAACARALAGLAAGRPWTEAELGALRELCDPALLELLAAQAPTPRRHLLMLWRRDLPLPPALASLQHGDAADRTALAAQLAERRETPVVDVLAALLDDADVDVRNAAGAALHRTYGELVPYDPNWPQTERRQATARLRALHNRKP